MKILTIIICLFLLSCNMVNQSDNFINSTNKKTLYGDVSNIENVKIGVFSNIYWFTANSIGETDLVYTEFPFITSGSFLPLYFVNTDAFGNYEIDLPLDPQDMGELIAWVDNDSDGIFDLGTEQGYFPVKSINGTEKTVSGFNTGFTGRSSYYLVVYTSEQGRESTILDEIGTSGFNFYID